MDPRTLVIGGGISGLAIAYGLMRRGEEVALWEADARPGGYVHSVAQDGFLLDQGPTGFIDREPATRDILEALQLAPRVVPASPAAKRRFLVRQGRLAEVPSSPGRFATSPILPLGAKLRLLGELFTRPGTQEEESLSAFFSRHLGPTATRVLVDAVQTGIFAGDPDRLSIQATFPKLAQLDRRYGSLVRGQLAAARAAKGSAQRRGSGILSSFQGGLETLPKALAEALGPRVRLHTRAAALEPLAPGWRAVAENGQNLSVERVILALPARGAAALVRPLAPAASTALEGIEHASVAVVHLAYTHSEAQSPQGFGFLAAQAEGVDLLGAIYASSTFPHLAPPGGVLFKCLMGGARRPQLLELTDAELVARCQSTLERLLGWTGTARFTQVRRQVGAIPQFNLGHRARVAQIRAELQRFPGLCLAGQSYDGVGINDCLRNAAALVDPLSATGSGRENRARQDPSALSSSAHL